MIYSNMLSLKEKTVEFFENINFKQIEEKNLLDTKNGHDFNTSLLVAHAEEILEEDTEKLFSIQKVFYPSGHDESIRFPLFSFFSIMSNFYMKNISSLDYSLNIAANYLKDICNIKLENIKIIINENTYKKYKDEFDSYFSFKQIFLTPKKNEYTFTNNGSLIKGEYVKFVYFNSNGFFPIYDFVLMKEGSKLHIEAGGILDRFIFLNMDKDTIFQTDIFEEMILAINEKMGSDVFTPKFDYIGYYIAHMIRSLSFVILDGLKPSNRSPRSKALRYWMKYLMIRMSFYNISPFVLLDLLSVVRFSIEKSGYLYNNESYERNKKYWIEEISNLYRNHAKEILNIKTGDLNNCGSIYKDVLSILSLDKQLGKIIDTTRISHGYPFTDESEQFTVIRKNFNQFIKE